MDVPLVEYEKLIEDIKESHPHLAEVLERAHKNRVRLLRQYQKGVRLEGLDEWLSYLKKAEVEFRQEPPLSDIAFLLQRVRLDFEFALEATLMGVNSVVLDMMRDVLETYMLLRDFAADPTHMQEWLHADYSTLLGKFAPKHLRRREAARRGIEVKDLGDTRDYRVHSAGLHVSPKNVPFSVRGIPGEIDPFVFDMCFWELYSHAGSIAIVIRLMWEAFAPNKPIGQDLDKALPKMKAGETAVKDMQEIWFSLLKASEAEGTEEE
jgi:hypothetical protein